MFQDITEKEEQKLIAFTLQAMHGDKTKTMTAIENLEPIIVQCMRDFKNKLQTKEPLGIKSYYEKALKKTTINDKIKNFDQRISNLSAQIDLELLVTCV